jgi:hypothetical protein
MFGPITTAALAQQDKSDPTFNGLANMVHCNLRTLVVCDGNYCADLSRYGGENLWISLATRQVSSAAVMGYAPTFPIEVTGVSEAAFNSFLHVKFTYPGPDGRPRSGLLVFVPKNSGGYDIHYGCTGTSEDLSKKFGSLVIGRSTIGGSCEIVNRP